MGDTSAVLG